VELGWYEEGARGLRRILVLAKALSHGDVPNMGNSIKTYASGILKNKETSNYTAIFLRVLSTAVLNGNDL
jgi:hypothetical protein